jgi:hypothetical protein
MRFNRIIATMLAVFFSVTVFVGCSDDPKMERYYHEHFVAANRAAQELSVQCKELHERIGKALDQRDALQRDKASLATVIDNLRAKLKEHSVLVLPPGFEQKIKCIEEHISQSHSRYSDIVDRLEAQSTQMRLLIEKQERDSSCILRIVQGATDCFEALDQKFDDVIGAIAYIQHVIDRGAPPRPPCCKCGPNCKCGCRQGKPCTCKCCGDHPCDHQDRAPQKCPDHKCDGKECHRVVYY